MSARLIWNVAETYEFGLGPSQALSWDHDPQAWIATLRAGRDLKEYVAQESAQITAAGYKLGDKRAATKALLSLIPHMVSGASPALYNGLNYLFKVAGDYLTGTMDTVSVDGRSQIALKDVIIGHTIRALLDGARASAPIDDWCEAALNYASWCNYHEGTRGKIWNANIFSTIGWPQILDYPIHECRFLDRTEPDLIALLCMYGKPEYAKSLVRRGYDLTELIIYSYQPCFWEDGEHKVIDLEYVAELCRYAIEMLDDDQSDEESLGEDHFEDEWPLSSSSQILTNFMAKKPETYRYDNERTAAANAMAYLKKNPPSV